MQLKQIDHFDSNYLKGIAILMIMLHNFFHILDGAPGENEFSFSTATTHTFLHNLLLAPADLLRQTFSFFGHYAVQIFIFLSGYGLAMKYKRGSLPSYFVFLQERFRKIYPVLLFAVVLLFLYKGVISTVFPNKAMELGTFAYEALLKVTLIANFIPGEALSISGPWWFFSLIFQLYLIAPLLLRIQTKERMLVFIFIPWMLQFFLITYFPASIPYVRVNLPGHLAEFTLGVYMARVSPKTLNPLLILPLLILFIAGSFNPYLWVISFTSIPVLALAAYNIVNPVRSSLMSQVIIFFGKNSLYFFAVHGLCRAPFVSLANQSVFWSILAAAAYLVVVVLLTMIFTLIVQTLMSWITTGWQAAFNRK